MPIIIPLIIATILGGGVVGASQGSLPGDALFPVKTLTEDVRINLSGSSEGKAKLHTDFAGQRVKEVSRLLEQKKGSADGLKIALANLERHSKSASSILESERKKGKNVSQFSQRLGQVMRSSASALRGQEDRLRTIGDDLRSRIVEAQSGSDSRRLSSLTSQSREIDSLRDLLEAERNRIEGLGNLAEATEDIREAAEKRQRLITEAGVRGVVLPQERLAAIDSRIAEARAAFDAGRFEQAEDLAHLARDIIRELDETLVDPNPNRGTGSVNRGPGSVNSGRDDDENEDVRGRDFELRGRDNEPNEDIRGNADELEIRGRDNEIEASGDEPRREDRREDRRLDGSLEIRGQESEVRGRVAEGEAPRGADSPGDVLGGGSSGGSGGSGSGGSGGSGRGGSDD